MVELIKIDIEKLSEYLRGKLKNFDEISGVYLFGSALNEMRPDSDIDLGIVLKPGFVETEKEMEMFLAKLAVELGTFEGHSFDLISVRDVNSILAFKIIREGIPIFIKDEDIVTDLIEFVSRKYSEDYPRYRRALEEIMEEIRNVS